MDSQQTKYQGEQHIVDATTPITRALKLNKLNARMLASGLVHSFNSNAGDNTGDSLHYIE